jgi:hypothetical protein
MPQALVGGAISGIGSIIGGITGAGAAGTAAQQQAQAAQQAAAGIRQAQGQSLAQQQQTTAGITGNLQPFVGLGQQSANALANLLAPGGALAQTAYTPFTAPTAAQAAQQPGYQFQLQQGLAALQNSAAARGGLLSTGTAKNLENYAQGLASTNYGNLYNQALQAYQTNFQNQQQLANQQYQRLFGTTQLGAQTGTSLGGLQQTGANALSNIYMGGAGQIGQYLAGAGQAQAAGTLGANQALQGAIGGVTGAATNALSQYFNPLNASGGISPAAQYADNLGVGGVGGAGGAYVPNIYTGY